MSNQELPSQELPSQEIELRKLVAASDGATVHPVARDLIEKAYFDPDKKLAGQAEERSNLSETDLKWYAKNFAQGVQWAHERRPNLEGLKDLLLGGMGDKIPYKDWNIEIKRVEHLRIHRIQESIGVIPFEDMTRLGQASRLGKVIDITESTLRSRLLGPVLAPDEMVFLGGVEEVWHAFQHQDPSMDKKYSDAEMFPVIEVGMHAGTSYHDTNPKEQDVAYVQVDALKEFRTRKESVSAGERPRP